MKISENKAIEIAKEYKKRYPKLDNEIKSAKFYNKVGEGKDYWIVTGEYELFGELKEFFYLIIDETGEVEYTFNEHGTRNPHLWNEDESKMIEKNDIDNDTIKKNDPKPNNPKGGWSVFD